MAAKLIRLLGIGVVAALVGFTACSTTPEPSHAALKPVAQRHQAPEFELKDQAGNIVHISDFKGKVVLLDFWATWCGPCQIEIPWFKEFESSYKDRGFEVVGVSMDQAGWKAVVPFAERKKMNYKLVMGDEKTTELYGGIEALPTAFIIDREGRVAAVHVGLSARKDFQDAIEQLL
jgi:cytochrome c biogenesis protein CcmG/thiol:disulfide interchange protein DsbE